MAVEQDDMFDARFEFDAPRYYDFEAMSSGTPADKWFETAPDGPGCKPESENTLGTNASQPQPFATFHVLSVCRLCPAEPGTSREPFKELQDNAKNQQQVRS
jgi:hypothetical protein